MATAVTLDVPVRSNPPTTAEERLEWPSDNPGEIVDGVFIPKYPDGVVTGTGTRLRRAPDLAIDVLPGFGITTRDAFADLDLAPEEAS